MSMSHRLALLFAFLPLLVFTETKEQLYLLAFCVGGLLWAAFSMMRPSVGGDVRTLPGGRMATYAAVHFGLLLISSSFSTMPMVSLWMAWIVGLLPLGYLAGRQLAFDAGGFTTLWRWMAAAVAITAGYACEQYLIQGWGRARGPFADFNAFGALLYVFVIPAIGFWLVTDKGEEISNAVPTRTDHHAPDGEVGQDYYHLDGNLPYARARAIHVAGILLGLAALFTTYSRGATGALLLALAPLALLLWHSGLTSVKRLAGVGAMLMLSYAAVKLYALGASWRTLDLAHDPSTRFRLMMWQSALQAWLDHPWLGTGLGTYQLHYLHYRLPNETDTTGSLAHNDYVQMLMEGGPVLLVCLSVWGLFALWLLVGLWRKSCNSDASPGERRNAAFSASFVLAVLALFAHAAVNFIFYVASLALVAGLYLGYAHAMLGAPPARILRLPIRPVIARGLAVLITLYACGGLLVDWAAGQSLNPPRTDSWLSVAAQAPHERYRVASVFAALRPHNVPAQETMAVTAADLAMQQRNTPAGLHWAQLSLQHARCWLQISQGNPFVYQVLGQLLWNFPALREQMAPLADNPESLLRQAIDRYHASPEGYRILARFLEGQNRPADALAVIASSLKWTGIPVTSEHTAHAWIELIRQGRELASQLALRSDLTPVQREQVQAINNFEFPPRN